MKKLQALLIAWGAPALFIFAIIDGAGLPTPGGLDIALMTLTIEVPERAYFYAVLALIGNMIGSIFLFLLARKGGEAMLVKYRTRPRFQRFEIWFQRYGLLTLFIPALLPIPMPLKFFLLCAAVFEVSLMNFIAVLLAARIPRYFGLAFLGRTLGTESVGWLKSHTWNLVAFALGLFMFLYLLIVIANRRRRAIGSA